MRKFLSIVVPRYQEAEREIFPLLSSISNQVGINFDNIEVLITTDGGGGPPLSKNFLGLFNFETKQFRRETNGGCGPARQTAMDEASGDYILCCDADDVLHNVGALAALIQEAESSAPDILISEFLEEVRTPDGCYHYIPHGPSECWMHGKLLRRKFLEQYNIRFHDDLKNHEDSYFLCISMSLAKHMLHLPATTYVWKFHPDSITRRCNGAYTYETAPEYVKAVTMAWETVEQLRPELMCERVIQFIHYNFFTLHRADWLEPEREKLLEKAETEFSRKIRPWMHYYYEAGCTVYADIYNAERNKSFQGGVETEALTAWLERLGLSWKNVQPVPEQI